jgi:alpha,alpha-trehalase
VTLAVPQKHTEVMPEPVLMPWARCAALPCLQIWGRLTRQVAPEVSRSPELYTMLPVPNPFIIPGARFREVSCRLRT